MSLVKFRCLVLIIVNRDLSSSTSFNPSFDMCSVQLIFPILRHTFISKASNLVMSSFLIVLISAFLHSTRSHFKSVFSSFFSSFFSILPLVILSSWKRLLSHCYSGASILGAEGRDPRFWAGGRKEGRRGGVGVVDESGNI